jgi:hypothetical protein
VGTRTGSVTCADVAGHKGHGPLLPVANRHLACILAQPMTVRHGSMHETARQRSATDRGSRRRTEDGDRIETGHPPGRLATMRHGSPPCTVLTDSCTQRRRDVTPCLVNQSWYSHREGSSCTRHSRQQATCVHRLLKDGRGQIRQLATQRQRHVLWCGSEQHAAMPRR